MEELNSYAYFDDSGWPILKIRFRRQEPSIEEFEAYLAVYKSFLLRQEKFYTVMDATDTKYLYAELRKRQAEWLKENEDLIAQVGGGIVFIIPNPLVRIVVNGVFLLFPYNQPYAIVPSMEKAIEWICVREPEFSGC